MILTTQSKIKRSDELPLAAGSTVSEDGQLMAVVTSNGRAGVKPATGAASEVLAGFSFIRTSAVAITPTSYVKVETFVVPAGGIVTVARTPLASSTAVYDVTAGAVITPGSVTGTAVDCLVANVGHTVNVTYRYALSAQEARGLTGDQLPSGYAGNSLGQCGIAQSGVIFTNQFDTSKDYSVAAGVALKAAAGGQVTVGGAGTAIPGYVYAVPTEDYPFLGIEFNFA